MLNWKPINNSVDGIFTDSSIGIIPRHNYLTGLRKYVLATLEQLLGYLSRKPINDDMIKFLSSSLYAVAQNGNERYLEVIRGSTLCSKYRRKYRGDYCKNQQQFFEQRSI